MKSTLTDSFRVQVMNGLHRPDHTYHLALFPSGTELSAQTEHFDGSAEVTGEGYALGGIVLTGRKVTLDASGNVILEFADITIERAKLEDVGCGLIFNGSLRSKPSVAVLAFKEALSPDYAPLHIPLSRLAAWPRGAR